MESQEKAALKAASLLRCLKAASLRCLSPAKSHQGVWTVLLRQERPRPGLMAQAAQRALWGPAEGIPRAAPLARGRTQTAARVL